MKSATAAQICTLEELEWRPDGLWWHDLHPSTRTALWKRGWICELRKERCNTRGHKHPGYVTISAAGLDVLHPGGES